MTERPIAAIVEEFTMTDDSKHPTTTDAGIPVASDEHSLSVGLTARCCSKIIT